MLNPFIWLLLLSITMLIGSFVFGCIPLLTKLSATKLRQLTAIGVGLLIGTSLVVIIPEGVETLYSSPVPTETTTIPSSLATATTSTHIPWQIPTSSASSLSAPTLSMTTDDASDHHSDSSSKHVAVGLALILGFALMFVIDQFSSLHGHSASRSGHDHELDSMLTTLRSPDQDDDNDDKDNDDENDDEDTAKAHNNNTVPSTIHPPHHRRHPHQAHSVTPTVGLMIHAAADGIALGASASHPQLSMVVFFAIMLHKGPSAFALTTVLMAEGMSRIEVRKHLLLFSMAAPTGALVTYLLLSLSSPGDMSLEYWTGVLLLFSGGTFLYVAMHALQELPQLEHTHVACILFGMFLPVLLNLGHSH